MYNPISCNPNDAYDASIGGRSRLKVKVALAACPSCHVERNSEEGTPECFHCRACDYAECCDPRLHTPEGEVME